METQNLHSCKICHKTLKSNRQLERHRRVHSEEQNASLQNHIATHAESGYSCEVCGKKFSVAVKRDRHLYMRHLREKKFKCDICGSGFAGSYDLNRHKKVHTAEREHVCHVCGNSYRWKHSLVYHMIVHTRKEKALGGQVTQRQRRHSISQQNEKEIDTDNHKRVADLDICFCNVCGQLFESERDLETHLDGHFKEKTYECKICSSRFTGIYVLTHHMKVHSAKIPHVCPHCGKQYRWRRALMKHLQAHTRIEMGKKKTQTPLRKDSEVIAELDPVASRTENNVPTDVNNLTGHILHTDKEEDINVSETFDGIKDEEAFVPLQVKNELFTESDAFATEILNYTDFPSHSENGLDQPFEDRAVSKSLGTAGPAETIETVPLQRNLAVPTRSSKQKEQTERRKRLSFTIANPAVHGSGNKHPCELCGKVLSSSRHYLRHKRLHTGEMPYACDICNRKFKWHSSLKSHFKSHERLGDDAAYACVCTQCGSVLESDQKLQEHVKLHAEQTHEVANSEDPRTDSSKSCIMQTPDVHVHVASSKDPRTDDSINKPFICLQCGVTYATEMLLLSHVSVHEDVTLFNCYECGEVCQDSASLEAHMERHNRGANPLQLDENAVSEERTVPVPSKPFHCDQCDKSFKFESRLKRHMVIHTRACRYHCVICDRSFLWHSSYTAHLRSHLTIKGHKRFQSISELGQHASIHPSMRQHECLDCGKLFKQKQYLSRHRYLHKDVKRFECENCHKKFRWDSAWRAHLLSRKKNKDCSCRECNVTFCTRDSYHKHMERHETSQGT